MKSVRSSMNLAVSLVFVISSAAFAQGFYWESTVTGTPGSNRISKTYVMPRLVKVEQGSGKHSAMIVDLNKKVFITLNDSERTYSEMTFDEMEARMKLMSKNSDAKMNELQEKMKSMPEEQRKMVEKMMGPMAGGTGAIEVKKTGEKKTILGYACSKMDVVQGEKTVLSVWTTKAVKGFDALRADWEEFSRRMAAQMPGNFGKAITEGMKKMEGFPMETDMGTIVSTVTKLEPRAIPASVFEVPAGYKKVEEKLFEKKEN